MIGVLRYRIVIHRSQARKVDSPAAPASHLGHESVHEFGGKLDTAFDGSRKLSEKKCGEVLSCVKNSSFVGTLSATATED